MRAARIFLQIGLIAYAVFTAVGPHEALAAEKRVALVIGNSAYQNTAPLKNPKNDAEDIARELKGMGFEVILGVDLDKSGMDRTLGEFLTALNGATVGLFFYGGHGLQVGGQNYLVPVDAKLLTQRSLDFEMTRLDLVQRAMERNTKTNIIFLDACRDNPLARNLARVLGTRSSELPRGLAAVESAIGTLISFSTQPGSVALDGDGRNSPFAAALTKYIGADESITDILINVRNEVVAATNQQQVPWEHSALRANFYFKGTKPAAPSSEPAATVVKPSHDQEAELELWTTVSESKSPDLFQSFIDQFPNGRFAATARLMVESLRKEQKQAREESEAESGIQTAELAEEARKAREALDAERRRVEAATATPPSPPTEVAALPGQAKSNAAAPGDKAALTLDVQKELKRVGCYSGEVDGKWGDGTRTALKDFATRAKITLSTDEPTQSALDFLSASKEDTCSEGAKRKSASDDGQSSSKSRQQKRASSSGNRKGRDCTPMNGPYGTYENLWCK